MIAVLGLLLLNGCGSDCLNGECTEKTVTQTVPRPINCPPTCSAENITTERNGNNTELYCNDELITTIPDVSCDVSTRLNDSNQTEVYCGTDRIALLDPHRTFITHTVEVPVYIEHNTTIEVPCELTTTIRDNGDTEVICSETGELVTVVSAVEHNTTTIVDNTKRSCPVTFQVYMDASMDNEPQEREIQTARNLIDNNHNIKIVLKDVEDDSTQVEAFANRNAFIIVPMQEDTPYYLFVNRTSNGNVIDDGGSFADIRRRGGLHQGYQPNVTAEEPFTIDCDGDNTFFLRYDPPVDENGDVIL